MACTSGRKGALQALIGRIAEKVGRLGKTYAAKTCMKLVPVGLKIEGMKEGIWGIWGVCGWIARQRLRHVGGRTVGDQQCLWCLKRTALCVQVAGQQ